jgi:hypothetical protein
VVLSGGETISGKVTASDGRIEVTTATGVRPVALTDVAALRDAAKQKDFERLEHPALRDLWAGSFDMGLALARGNAKTDTLTTGFQANRTTRTDKLSANLSQIRGSARVNGTTSKIANAIRGGWAYQRQIAPRLFATSLNDYEHDQFQNLSIRIVAGGGLGVQAVRHKGLSLDVSAGGDFQHESFQDGQHRNSGEANFGDTLNYKLNGSTTLAQSARVFANLTETGTYRVNFDLGIATRLRKWLSWQVTFSDRFMSNPLFGRQRNDLLLSTGFRLTFAQ